MTTDEKNKIANEVRLTNYRLWKANKIKNGWRSIGGFVPHDLYVQIRKLISDYKQNKTINN